MTNHTPSSEPGSVPAPVSASAPEPASDSAPDPISDSAPDPVSASASASAGPRTPSAARRRVFVAGVVVASLAAAGAVFAGAVVTATIRHDIATAAFTLQSQQEAEAAAAYSARLRSMEQIDSRLQSIGGAADFAADTSAPAEALRQSIAGIDSIVQSPLPVPAPDAAADANATDTADAGAGATPASAESTSAGYVPPWTLFEQALAIEESSHASQRSETALLKGTSAARAAEDAVDPVESAYFKARAVRAEDAMASAPLSDRSLQVALMRLIEDARAPGRGVVHDCALVSAIAAGEAQLQSSQTTHEAERDDPAWATRVEIEDYARSISNGVALEFVWEPVVGGYGEDWLSGTAQTWDSDGGWAIIHLNYTIEEAWDEGPDARALVTHEVGHTQVFRENCRALFTGPVFGQSQETWATAWSISHGFDVPGSGIEAYGRPSEEQIAVAGECR
ncbi:hypothetical protein [Herbiconiux sp. YIM B11900]|uniref:hypothetical protein n=1 Tax=Herbiconiux sp. YIM B11900 TaxID=3404131 RepID=UPI003F83C84B